jgi:hypothetical protein
LEPLRSAIEQFLEDVGSVESLEYQLEREWRALPADHPERITRKLPEIAGRFGVQGLRDSANGMQAWLESSAGQALRRGLYFLAGPAGSGKTHLFLDAVQRALSDRRPAVALAGARFGRGDLWGSICDQLGLEPLGADVLLGAMDAAGEASATTGRRFLILIDALNETPSTDFWLTHLPSLRAAVARWPHVALAVSCRDTYLEVVDDGTERSHYEQRTHPGFAGRETDATQRYFDHYGLETPRIPLLVPEFSLPLFLRLYCESLSAAEPTTAAAGHEGRVRIFGRYIKAKLTRVARRLRPAASTSYEIARAKDQVTRIVNALLDEFAATGLEAMPRARGEELAASALDSTEDAAIVLGALQSEGVLARELLYLGDGRSDEGFRIVFQAFADFLILRRRLDEVSDPRVDADIQKWLRDDCSWGILDAAAVALPEVYGVELPDVLELSARDLRQSRRDDLDTRRRSGRARHIFRSVVTTLPYRDTAAITARTIELLNESLPLLSRDEFFRILILMAPQPRNRLNGDGLHRYLMRFRMPRRDAYFGIAMYHEIWDEASPVVTLARWASRGPYPAYDPTVVELACIPLIWLLSSPNRFMRDWITKALVQLLRGHLDVMTRLLDRFYVVDDPYLVQRVVVIAYGALMRSDPANAREARRLAGHVRKRVFTRPVRADELLLDAGRGIVEWAATRKLLPRRALDDIERPYGLAPPSAPPTEATLERKYGFQEKQPDEESYSSIRLSLMSMGDFGRYVVGPGMRMFSSFRRDRPLPLGEPRPRPQLIKVRWNSFLRSLTANQRRSLDEIVRKESTGDFNQLTLLLSGFQSTLTKEQSTLLNSAWKEPARRRWRDDDYPSDRARRWIFRRTLSLGWTPKLFGRADRSVGHGRGRESHKAERWGKKYQWMAYHELLARVADNYHSSRHFDDAQPYEGLHQIIGDREMDPSLPPIDYGEFVEKGEGPDHSWRQSPVEIVNWPPARIDFARYRGDVKKFIDDRESEPTLDKVTFVTDAEGLRWVMLDASISQGDPAEDKYWRGLQQPFAINTLLSPAEEAASLVPNLAVLRQANHWDLLDTHGHVDCCYAGEIGWSPRNCYHFHRDLREVEADGQRFRIVPTTETVAWEGSLLDCSIQDTVSARMPSSFMYARTELLLDERGPSWMEYGEVVATNYGDESRDRSRALLVRDTWLSRFLHAHRLELVISSWHQRWAVHENPVQGEPWESVYAAGRLDADLNLHLAIPIRESR